MIPLFFIYYTAKTVIKIPVIAINQPMVYSSNDTASFLFPSRYQRIGFPKTTTPITAAEVTNSDKNVIALRMPPIAPNNLSPFLMIRAINEIYTTAITACSRPFVRIV